MFKALLPVKSCPALSVYAVDGYGRRIKVPSNVQGLILETFEYGTFYDKRASAIIILSRNLGIGMLSWIISQNNQMSPQKQSPVNVWELGQKGKSQIVNKRGCWRGPHGNHDKECRSEAGPQLTARSREGSTANTRNWIWPKTWALKQMFLQTLQEKNVQVLE